MTDGWLPMSEEVQHELIDAVMNEMNEEEPGWLEGYEVTDQGILLALAWTAQFVNPDYVQAPAAMTSFMVLAKAALERGIIEGIDTDDE